MPQKVGVGVGRLWALFGVIVGVFLGRWFQVILWGQWAESQKAYGDVFLCEWITMAIGVVLVFFGARVHRIVRYVGLGVIAQSVAQIALRKIT